MIPDTSTPSQIPDVLNTKTGILNRLWEKLLNNLSCYLEMEVQEGLC